MRLKTMHPAIGSSRVALESGREQASESGGNQAREVFPLAAGESCSLGKIATN